MLDIKALDSAIRHIDIARAHGIWDTTLHSPIPYDTIIYDRQMGELAIRYHIYLTEQNNRIPFKEHLIMQNTMLCFRRKIK